MMRFFLVVFRVFLITGFFLSVVSVNAAGNGDIKHSAVSLEKYHSIDWSKYTLDALNNKIPKKFYGHDVRLLPSQALYFLPSNNMIEMNQAWESYGNPWPRVIVLANGVYTLEQVESLISIPHVFKRINEKTFISYRPIYIAPTATLVIRDRELRLSLLHGSFVMSSGSIFIIDSMLTSWNEKTQNYGVREYLPDEEMLLYAKQFPRPYLLGLSGSKIYAGNSIFRGLGHKGKNGSYGVSMSNTNRLSSSGISHTLSLKQDTKQNPSGWLIGNTFEKNFFGYYSKHADDVVIVGNIYRDNVIYNIDPHDYSDNLLISRNLSYQAERAHGIITSRGVVNTIISDNLTLKNKGSGIMLDRSSEYNLVYNNISLENEGSGISIFESDHNDLVNNISARNGNNGVYIRNSCNIKLESNYLFRNLNAGSEVSIVDIDSLETRDFALDTYHKMTSVDFFDNEFDSNITSAINSKNKPGIALKENVFNNSGTSYFSGDLASYNRDILSYPSGKKFIYEGGNRCH
jgi:poly(beta-D-mannuronate) C5 epimerase